MSFRQTGKYKNVLIFNGKMLVPTPKDISCLQQWLKTFRSSSVTFLTGLQSKLKPQETAYIWLMYLGPQCVGADYDIIPPVQMVEDISVRRQFAGIIETLGQQDFRARVQFSDTIPESEPGMYLTMSMGR